MSSSSDNEFVILTCTNPNAIEPDVKNLQTLISTADIHAWDLSSILRNQTIQIQAHRNRLVEQSTYFHGLLGGSFSESNLECVSIQWELEAFVNLLMFIYGCPLDITSRNFLSLFELALYFGVEALLSKCRIWFFEAAFEGTGVPAIELDDLIHIWNFGLEYANDFIPELCACYLARNFMWATSSKSFGDVPHKLLLCSIKHPHLTVDSEMQLSEGLLVWLSANTKQLESLSKTDHDFIDILKEVVSRFGLAFGRCGLQQVRCRIFLYRKRRSVYFSKLAADSIQAIFSLLTVSATALIDKLGDSNLGRLRIRSTKYSKKVNLSGCPQLTAAILLLSLLPCSYSLDLRSRKSLKQSLMDPKYLTRDQSEVPHALLPYLSFEAIEEVDISRCHRLDPEVAIACFSMSFPCLRKLKAAYLLNFKTSTMLKLMHKCAQISEVDLTVDITPLIAGQVSVVSSSPAITPRASSSYIIAGSNSLDVSLSNITRLTLEGRTDIFDSCLQYISRFCVSLHYINLKGCISVTDIGISNLVCGCIKLHSLLVCDTSFGRNSIVALCTIANIDSSLSAHIGKEGPATLASKLQTLHMGGCKGVDEGSLLELTSQAQTLKNLCLRGTYLTDDAIYNFPGSLLETLDVSNTMISGAALAHIVLRSPALKSFIARDCRNLIQLESYSVGVDFSISYQLKELYTELGKKCRLEKISFGWGFSYFSLEALKPAISSLRAVTVGLGGLLGEEALRSLHLTCPMLEEICLYFQVISDSIMTNIMASLIHLQVLVLFYCVGDISISSFNLPMPNLRKLWLRGVTPWLTNNDLVILTENFGNLVDFSMLGCRLLNSDSLHLITHRWPGLISIHIEDCGEITANGVSPLFNCRALEDLVLRHNGAGIHKSFILEAASKLPMLRKVSLDFCDVCDGDLDIPDYDNRYNLSIVKIARCKFQRCSSNPALSGAPRMLVHKETLVMVWSSEGLTRTVVKERL